MSGQLAIAGEMRVTITAVDAKGVNAVLGTVVVSESKYGLVFTPMLKGLAPGLHGFHLHENPSCAAGEKDGAPAAAIAAGGHYDPQMSKKHGTPWGDGHLGDLPPLYVDAQGNAQQAVLAPRLKLSDLSGHSLMLHAGGDNPRRYAATAGWRRRAGGLWGVRGGQVTMPVAFARCVASRAHAARPFKSDAASAHLRLDCRRCANGD